MTDQSYNALDALDQLDGMLEDQSVASAGGGERILPEEGLAGLRFVEYIELGKFEEEFEGKKKTVEKVILTFELFGSKWPLIDGKPLRMSWDMTKSTSEKSHYFRLFKSMNYDGTATHMAKLLGRAFMGNVRHQPTKKDPTKKYASLRDLNNIFTIRAPVYEDPITNEKKNLEVPPMVGPAKVFLFDHASKPMWDSLFIDGMYEEKRNEKGEVTHEAKSKNWLQERIMSAMNFPGSKLAAMVQAGGLPNIQNGAIKVERSGASEDPLSQAA
ncbi:hypothetical protein CPT_Percy23 [Caulobacter phage Percy]|uniref:Uncharacterized protein n=1 Tax=Caulobacter phage Percy TaxID=1701809 RepID=A0A0M4S4X2_9CAUD|nr:hypothetical protein CPT_Percy23 [Caulobacter phage Percy]ALF01657.1 hypothetical protein CPT_Percy23 [Caulobacter phage Percy]